jgi:hypothetical protein
VDVAVWRQRRSLTVHLVNLNNPMTMAGSFRAATPAGPYSVNVALPAGATIAAVRLLEADKDVVAEQTAGRLTVEVPSVSVHEIVAIDLA